MDPTTQRLEGPPRSLRSDAFFSADRSTTAVSRTVNLIELDAKGHDKADVAPAPATFAGFANKHALIRPAPETNPLPQARMLRNSQGKLETDASVAGWKHDVVYTSFFSSAARALSGTATDQPRLKVKLLFGTGSEYYRHGVCGAVEASAEPTLLIVVPGVEPHYKIEFWNPADRSQKRELEANNRWGVGITKAAIEKIIAGRYGRLISYDITVGAAFSTGYLGLQGSIAQTLFPLDALKRVVIFDCLYGTLKSALDRVQALTGAAIVAYVATQGGNSFHKDLPITVENLALGGNPKWSYVNLIGNTEFHAVTSARIVDEGRSTTARILNPLPSDYEKALDALVAKLPARNTLVSSKKIFDKVRGPLPSGAKVLGDLSADKDGATAIRDFFRQVITTRQCIGRAQLMGWPAPAGEEWHDMILVEFAWEFLS